MEKPDDVVPRGEEPSTETVLGGGPGGPGLPPFDPAAGFERGRTFGRYVILDRIGSGGMGVVYSAYDPELDRRIALKFLRADRAARDPEAARLRLLREAQAIARLSHPGVVSVYDAGSFGDQVFVAMELVPGRTLRQWLQEEKPGWREILERFRVAGRGLAAAHAAGLVHRDFKPDNVLVGDDGRVRVADFGLARPAGGAEAPEAPGPGAGGVLDTPITEWGIHPGTPAYMAPEQLQGRPADARSDQFSFCVALYEALYGQRPFPGVAGVEEVREAPAGTRVPGWLRQVLLRGLRRDPAARYPSMDELLRELERDPEAGRRRWLVAAAVVLVTGALFSGLGYFQARRERLCSGGEAKLAGVWDANRKQTVHAAFLAVGTPLAEAAWHSVEPMLDRYTADWVRLRRDACEATRVRGEQSEDLLDRRMYCLDQDLEEASFTVGLLAPKDEKSVEESLRLVEGLPNLAACSDVEALTSKVPLPHDPAQRARIEAARARVSEVRVLIEAGRYPEARPKADEAVKLASGLGYAPLKAEALFEQARLQELTQGKGAEEGLFEAFATAQEAGHSEIAARAASQLAFITGVEQTRAEEGKRWSRLAVGIADGAKLKEGLRSSILQHLAGVRGQAGSFQEAIGLSLRALPLAERAYGPESIDLASIENNLGEFYNQIGQSEEALRHIRRALEIREKVLPPDHPHFVGSYTTLGNVYLNLGRLEEASRMFQRAYDLSRRSYGPEHWRTAGALYSLGIAQQDLGQLDAALRSYRQAMAVFKTTMGPEHFFVANCLASIGEALRLQGKAEESLAHYQQAQALAEGKGEPWTRFLPIVLVGISRNLVALGRAREAIPTSQRALELFEKQESLPAYVEQARFVVAEALWEGGGDRARALRLARQSREGLVRAGDQSSLGEVDAWLKQRGVSG